MEFTGVFAWLALLQFRRLARVTGLEPGGDRGPDCMEVIPTGAGHDVDSA